MKWVYLFLAVVCEVMATSALKASEDFTKLWPSVIVIIGYGMSFYLLSLTLRKIPLGVAYAIWSGLGVALITGIGYFYFKQKIDIPAILGILMIVGGVLVINLFSKSVVHQ